ncbi:hypothetical protein CsSME_00005075 [Camellia sinensis var. sinensis]
MKLVLLLGVGTEGFINRRGNRGNFKIHHHDYKAHAPAAGKHHEHHHEHHHDHDHEHHHPHHVHHHHAEAPKPPKAHGNTVS